MQSVQELTVPSHVQDALEIEYHEDGPDSKYVRGQSFRASIDYKKSLRSLHIPVGGKSQSYTGIFDTGAQSICVHAGIPEHEDWSKVGESVVSGAVGSEKVSVYRGGFDLKFDNSYIHVINANLIGVPLPGDTQFLIGQPLIKLFEFIVWKDFKGVSLDWGIKEL